MKRSCFMAAAFLVFGGSASAQGTTDSLRVVEIGKVSVSAHRAGEKTPVAYTNITRAELSRVNNGVDVPFMLTMTPSVVATSDAGTGIGYTSVSIRGTDGTRINVTANGVPLNDGESHKLFWVNLPDFASSAEDIQVQRGVGTSTNGPGAFGGSVNMMTEPLSTVPFAEISGTYGSYNTHRESIRFGTGLIGGKWAFSGRLSNIGSDGYIDRASADMKSYFAQAGYFGRTTSVKLISFGGKEETYHAWNGLTQEQIDTYGRRYNTAGEIFSTNRFGQELDAAGNVIDDNNTNAPAVVGFYPDQKDYYSQYHTHLIIGQRLSDRWSLNLTGHYTRGDGYYEEYKNSRTLTEYGLEKYTIQDDNGNDVTVKKSNLVRRKQMWNNFGGAIVSAAYRSDRLEAVIGGAWNRYAGDHFGRVTWIKNYVNDNLSPDHEYYRNTTTKDDANIFAKASWTVARGLSVYGDVQYRHISHKIDGSNDNYDWTGGYMQRLDVGRKYDFFNPKVGVYYDINARHAVYASFAVAHKEPTRNDFTDAKFDASPKPERLMDWELGYKFSAEKVSAGANFYYMHYKDQLVQTGELNDIGEPLAANVPDSFRAGVELTLGVQLTKWFRWDIFGTFSRNRILDYTEFLNDEDYAESPVEEFRGNTDIAFSPSVIAGNIFSFSAGGFYGAVQTNYVSKQYMNNAGRDELTLPRYCVTNVRASYRFRLPAMKYLELGIAVNNVFDTEYSSYGYGSSTMKYATGTGTRRDYPGYFPQATANVLGTVTLSF